MATEKLGATDLHVVDQVVADAGYSGEELTSMSAHVAQLLVGKVQALDDNMPTTGGD